MSDSETFEVVSHVDAGVVDVDVANDVVNEVANDVANDVDTTTPVAAPVAATIPAGEGRRPSIEKKPILIPDDETAFERLPDEIIQQYAVLYNCLF